MVLSAISVALDAGIPNKTHVLNLLHLLLGGKPLTTPLATARQALRLISESIAIVKRYDTYSGRTAMRHDPASNPTIIMCAASRWMDAGHAPAAFLTIGVEDAALARAFAAGRIA